MPENGSASMDKQLIFCSNCGKQIPARAKFCTFCGEKVELVSPSPEELAEQKPKEPVKEYSKQDVSDSAYRLMDPGTEFQGYKIVRLMNKDSEGIKYIAEKDGRQYVLKVFFRSKFSNLSSLFSLQMRLKHLNKLDTAHTAKVVEVNQAHDPAYMVAEHVSGTSLANIKANKPELLTEDFVREIAKQLISTAIAVRQEGLTICNLTLTGIMLADNGKIVVLSSGITYEDVDEREDIFNIGVIIAQLLSHNSLYKSIYDADRLKVQKFPYVSGGSIGLNKLLSECLHRNILQRFSSLKTILHDLERLPPVEEDEIYVAQGKGASILSEGATEVPKPRIGIDYLFWILVGVIVVIVALLLTTNIYSVLFGGKQQTLTTIFAPRDTTQTETTVQELPPRRFGRTDTLRITQTRNTPTERRTDPRLASSAITPATTPKTTTSGRLRVPVPATFQHIGGATFGFNRLKENLNHNVSQSDYHISKYEVTQAEWNKYMMPANVSHVGDNLPVDNISWINIIRYCNARSEDEGLEPAYKISSANAAVVTCNFRANGYRLPTEAEWEMAAKAGELYAYSGSDDPSEVAWHRENSGGRIRSVGGKKANAWGLYDMSGNVSEWCWDWFDAKYPSTLPTFINPTGPETGTQKVIRGGNVFNGEGRNLGILWREKGDPSRGYQFVGFRLVRTF